MLPRVAITSSHRCFVGVITIALALSAPAGCGDLQADSPPPAPPISEGPADTIDAGVVLVVDGDAADASSPRAPSPGARLVRVIQYNITGHARPGTAPVGEPPNGGSLEALAYLESEMKQFPADGAAIPDAVLLEEVCFSQFADLAARYTPDKASTHVVFNSFMQRHPLCAGEDKRLGQVLLSPWPITNAVRTELGDTDTSYGTPDTYIVFGMLCGDVHAPGLPKPLRTCVTHLRGAAGVPVDTYKGQVDKIAAVLDPLVEAGVPVVVGGDLNNRPEYRTLDPLYRLDRVGGLGGPGKFDEADQTDATWFSAAATKCTGAACRSGERTTARLDPDGVIRDVYKFDYVFFSRFDTVRGGFTDPSADARPFVTAPVRSRSDHHLYRAQATLHH